VLERETSQTTKYPAKLIAPMVERFMATDRGFAKLRRQGTSGSSPLGKGQLSKRHLAYSRHRQVNRHRIVQQHGIADRSIGIGIGIGR
tara:strand:+ start:203 stop:466 length:264 start_codon:yes stop_codon:yes gene_type:complete